MAKSLLGNKLKYKSVQNLKLISFTKISFPKVSVLSLLDLLWQMAVQGFQKPIREQNAVVALQGAVWILAAINEWIPTQAAVGIGSLKAPDIKNTSVCKLQ